MALLFAGISVVQPLSGTYDKGDQFTFEVSLTWAGGHGGNEGVNINYEYSTTSSTGPWNLIPASGAILTTTATNPTAFIYTTPQQITVDVNQGSGASVWIRAWGDAAADYYTSAYELTINPVTAAHTESISLSENSFGYGVDESASISESISLVDHSENIKSIISDFKIYRGGVVLPQISGQRLVNDDFAFLNIDFTGNPTGSLNVTESDDTLSATGSATGGAYNLRAIHHHYAQMRGTI